MVHDDLRRLHVKEGLHHGFQCGLDFRGPLGRVVPGNMATLLLVALSLSPFPYRQHRSNSAMRQRWTISPRYHYPFVNGASQTLCRFIPKIGAAMLFWLPSPLITTKLRKNPRAILVR